MKRFMAMLLITIMTAMTVSVRAENMDLSAYDDAALVELMEQVQQEVADRRIGKTAEMLQGRYIGGRDIPCGTYIWTCMATGSESGSVTVYSLDDNGGHDKRLLWEIVGAPEDGEEPESFLITVNEGDELNSQVPFSLTIYVGVVFE